MLKILNFFKSNTGETKLLTQRQRFEAAQDELNAVLADLSEMPVISIDASARKVSIVAPDQFADEALALPAPETSQDHAQDNDASPTDDTSKD